MTHPGCGSGYRPQAGDRFWCMENWHRRTWPTHKILLVVDATSDRDIILCDVSVGDEELQRAVPFRASSFHIDGTIRAAGFQRCNPHDAAPPEVKSNEQLREEHRRRAFRGRSHS